MAHRIEIVTTVNDTRSAVIKDTLIHLGFPVTAVKSADVYTIAREMSAQELEKVAEMLANPLTQSYLIDTPHEGMFDFALEIGFLPGVTDNVGHTARESIEDLLKITFSDDEGVHSAKILYLSGRLTREETEKIGMELANPLIQRIEVKSREEGGMEITVPKVRLTTPEPPLKVELNLPEKELIALGKEGIKNPDGSRRGPLALDREYLEAIREYFAREGRAPTDIELETIAQTWSEHCKHTIFASEIDELKDGLYKGYIKKATREIRAQKGENDFCISVFSDNSGGIAFDKEWIITDKAETHNTPSALDPFGGAITGIVGVNRDCMGFGKGAKPIINAYGFCVGDPFDREPLYRDKARTQRALPPRRILHGIIEGVNEGGNCSGIPTPQGFVYFHESYKGKPLVFVRTVGRIPREINGAPSWEKGAQKGDKIVMLGGRVGQDGIHGATFSSEELSPGSPATAVQIGDPITQKKMSDALIKEARDKGMYHSITDNGAGGLSCSVAEMARECGGFEVELEKIPLKYPHLEPWKIWISESQERMTLAISPKKVDDFVNFMNTRGVEATVIGEFNESGRCKVKNHGEVILDLDMDFLHEGVPRKKLYSHYEPAIHPAPDFETPEDLTETLHEMLARPNICGYEFISNQYDHNVQGGTVIGPLQGAGRINGPASVTTPLFDSRRGIVCSQGINPLYSEIDTYHMAACAIDTAVRNAVTAGADPDYLALMDNFCWCSSDDPLRLGQLKEATRACYEYAVHYGTPYISGKDSMFNDFKGYDKNGNPLKISALPTLLISSLGIIEDVVHALSIDPKLPGDLVYILGETKHELGGSEYVRIMDPETPGNDVPKVEASTAKALYHAFHTAAQRDIIASGLSPSLGGLAIALAKKAIAGQLGMEIELKNIPRASGLDRADYLLFSESQSRIIVTINPKHKEAFESHFKDIACAHIGVITESPAYIINDWSGTPLIRTTVSELEKAYKSTFKEF